MWKIGILKSKEYMLEYWDNKHLSSYVILGHRLYYQLYWLLHNTTAYAVHSNLHTQINSHAYVLQIVLRSDLKSHNFCFVSKLPGK